MSQVYTLERFAHSLSQNAFAMFLLDTLPRVDWPTPHEKFQFLNETFQILKTLPLSDSVRFHMAAADLFALAHERDAASLLNGMPDELCAVLPPDFGALHLAERLVLIAHHAPEFMDRLYMRRRMTHVSRSRVLTRSICCADGNAVPSCFPQERLDDFAAQVSAHVVERELCGRFYRIRHDSAPGDFGESFLLTLSGHPYPLEQWSEDGSMAETLIRETFDIVFQYDRARSLLSLRARGSASEKTELCRIWARAFCGGAEVAEPPVPEYDIGRFLTHNGAIYPAGDSLIRSVLCVSVEFTVTGKPTGGRVYRNEKGRLGDDLREEINHACVPYESMNVNSVLLKFFFVPGVSRHKSATIEVRRDSAGISAAKLPPNLRRAVTAWLEDELRTVAKTS